MTSYEGIVKDNAVILDGDVHLPDGLRVVIMIGQENSPESSVITPGELSARQSIISRMKEFGQRLDKRAVNLSREVLAEREELDQRA